MSGATSPAERNKAPILAVLGPLLAPGDTVLEIASGAGTHVDYFAEQLPHVEFQPSELAPESVTELTQRFAKRENIRPAIGLDVLKRPADWGAPGAYKAVIVANLFHISAVRTMVGYLQGAQRVVRADGFLHIYGPFNRNGRFTSAGNEAFDASLRLRNPLWGIRELETLLELAERHGFAAEQIVEQPANNLSVVLRNSET